MKIVGIIAEYNPFHKGHEFHIEKAKKITGADAAIIIMSGDYVQRGIPSIMPKHLRTQMALACGADVVFRTTGLLRNRKCRILLPPVRSASLKLSAV